MKQIVVTEPYNAILVDAEIPVPGKDEILLKTEVAGVCGSDAGLYKGTMTGYATYPRIGGHEVSAIVVEVNSDDTDLVPGDRVTINPYFNCGHCYSCRRGLVNCCVNNKSMGLPIDGIYRDYFAINKDRVYKATGLSAEETALVEPFCIGYHASKLADPKPGERALVMGAGTIATVTMMSLKLAGAEVYVANRSEWRLNKSKELGSDGIILYSSPEELLSKCSEITNDEGFDIVVDAVGDPDVLERCTEVAAHRARVVEVGISGDRVSIPISSIQKKELIIMGSRNALRKDFEEVIEHIRAGRVDVTKLITKRYTPEDPDAVFRDVIGNNKSLKNIIDFRK